MLAALTDKIKSYSSIITTIFTIIATIGGAVIYVQNNYASAQDVKELIRNQRSQIEYYQRNQNEGLMFRWEYYNDRILKLQEEKRIAEEREKNNIKGRAVQKTSSEINEEIIELKQRRELVKKSIIDVELVNKVAK